MFEDWNSKTQIGTFTNLKNYPTQEGRYEVLLYPYTEGSQFGYATVRFEGDIRKWHFPLNVIKTDSDIAWWRKE